MDIKTGRLRGLLSLPRIILAILLGACLVSLLFFVFWRQLNQ
jgi:predicted permease